MQLQGTKLYHGTAVSRSSTHGLVTQPRPTLGLMEAMSTLLEVLGPPFRRGIGGPGGWVILVEPELQLGPHVLAPDLAGWRRETIPERPDAARSRPET